MQRTNGETDCAVAGGRLWFATYRSTVGVRRVRSQMVIAGQSRGVFAFGPVEHQSHTNLRSGSTSAAPRARISRADARNSASHKGLGDGSAQSLGNRRTPDVRGVETIVVRRTDALVAVRRRRCPRFAKWANELHRLADLVLTAAYGTSTPACKTWYHDAPALDRWNSHGWCTTSQRGPY